ncbi:AMP-binding protein [Geothrix sp.]|jgi:acyl-CoA synthetase (AMP-forming)/AMP-acid ligase II|uniref:AMP-binding protein n=1 Tax=Geothrix sp. TaxID=1962974 RepID=UPI0025BC0FDB|nr:AMP-binding protein [Geothrix sp.]
MLDLIKSQDPAAEALVDVTRGERLTYAGLIAKVVQAAEVLTHLNPHRGVVFLGASPTTDFVALYLACLKQGMPVLLRDARAPAQTLLETYLPSLVLEPLNELPSTPDPKLSKFNLLSYSVKSGGPAYAVHPNLAVMLTTSGSTGSPKLVRLTQGNLKANAKSIASYLHLGPGERAIQSLPMHYSYGLSILNSHLGSGGTVVLTPDSFLRPEFWKQVDTEACTSFAGIPYMYETLHRIRFNPKKHPTLRSLTQAGGGLKRELISHFHGLSVAANIDFYVMYGQTEASARISYLPPSQLERKLGSIGIPIPDGRLSLRPVDGLEGQHELIYEGPNVMMGYAESIADLAKGDELLGSLATGDLATVDEDGFFTLVGRLNRFAKLFGNRVGLEDLERMVERDFKCSAAAIEGENQLFLFLETLHDAIPDSIALSISKSLQVPPNSIKIIHLDAIPRSSSGKMDYLALRGLKPC